MVLLSLKVMIKVIFFIFSLFGGSSKNYIEVEALTCTNQTGKMVYKVTKDEIQAIAVYTKFTGLNKNLVNKSNKAKVTYKLSTNDKTGFTYSAYNPVFKKNVEVRYDYKKNQLFSDGKKTYDCQRKSSFAEAPKKLKTKVKMKDIDDPFKHASKFKWTAAGMACDLNGGVYNEYSKKYGELFTSQGKPQPGTARRVVKIEKISDKKFKIISKATGDKRMWLKMAKRNAMINVRQKNLLESGKADKIESLRKLLNMPDLNRVECFDISHTMGNQTIASCVVYDDLAMQNKEYRRFNINDITPGDDYAAMYQVLERRVKRIINEEQAKPDMMLIDGGKGQLKMALDVFDKYNVVGIRLVSIVKGEGRKSGLESLILDDGEILKDIPNNNIGFHLLQHIRDEAHRFAITGHRQKRAKTNLSSSLEEIEGIGPKKRKALLVYFGGLDGIRNASVEELSQVTGIDQKLAEIVYNFYH